MRRRGKLVLWPTYFDTDLTWRQGRRASKKLAIRGVKAEEVFKAANDLDLNPILDSEAVFSKQPWMKTGVVFVDKTGPKTEVLKAIVLKIRQNRARK